MSRFAGQMSRPWVGMAGSGTASEPAADVARDDAAAAAASSIRGADSATNASAISFGFAATAVLVSMFLLMAIFEHLIKPGLASSSSSSSRGSRSHDDDDGDDDIREGRGHGRRLGLPPARQRERDASPDKLSHSPKVEPVAAVVDLTVLMPGQRYPTFLAQPAPLAPCPREGVLWPSHDHRRSFVLWPANNNSARGFPVVDDIKSALEEACPGIVSCADILALAAEISVELAGGPRWRVLLGRRDGTTTNVQSARNLPNFFDPLSVLQEKFRNLNLDDTDLVALQGAHTFGKVQCQFTQQNCTAGQSRGALENLDQVTPKVFDNKYYSNLLQGRAQLPSDQVMLSDPSAAATTAPIVHRFAGNQQDFFKNFAVSMIKMGNISPLTGKDGEIRNNCRRVNKRY